jgi:hypothetical protein
LDANASRVPPKAPSITGVGSSGNATATVQYPNATPIPAKYTRVAGVNDRLLVCIRSTNFKGSRTPGFLGAFFTPDSSSKFNADSHGLEKCPRSIQLRNNMHITRKILRKNSGLSELSHVLDMGWKVWTQSTAFHGNGV